MVRRLLYLNGIAACLVPVHHGAAYGFAVMFNWGPNAGSTAAAGSLAYFMTLGVRQVVGFAIPAFLLISAFSIAISARGVQGLKWEVIASRLKHLVWPFVIWTIFTHALLMNDPRELTLDDILGMYYYIPVLAQLLLLSPFLVNWVKRSPRAALLVTGVIQFTTMAVRYLAAINVHFGGQRLFLRLTAQWLFPGLIFYFTLGLVVGLHLVAAKEWLDKYRRVLVAVVIGSAVLSMLELHVAGILSGEGMVGAEFVGLFRTIYAVTFLLMYLAFDKGRLPLAEQIEGVGVVSLGVFYLNTPTNYVISSLLLHFIPAVVNFQWVYQPILMTAGLALPLLFIWFVRRSPLKPAYRYLFG
jgi:hypothetical protein